MAKHNLSAGVTWHAPMTPDTPLHALAPGPLSRLTPLERARKLKRTSKKMPDHAALVTPQSILSR